MPEDLAASLGRLAKQLKQPAAILGPLPKAQPRPTKLLLYVYITKCRHCGTLGEWVQDYLLGVYPPSVATEKYHAAKYVGTIPDGVPCILIRHKEPLLHDWCPNCFPYTSEE